MCCVITGSATMDKPMFSISIKVSKNVTLVYNLDLYMVVHVVLIFHSTHCKQLL